MRKKWKKIEQEGEQEEEKEQEERNNHYINKNEREERSSNNHKEREQKQEQVERWRGLRPRESYEGKRATTSVRNLEITRIIPLPWFPLLASPSPGVLARGWWPGFAASVGEQVWTGLGLFGRLPVAIPTRLGGRFNLLLVIILSRGLHTLPLIELVDGGESNVSGACDPTAEVRNIFRIAFLTHTASPCNVASSKHAGSWETRVALGNHEAQPSGFPTLPECSANARSIVTIL